jgi:hypothetical protein
MTIEQFTKRDIIMAICENPGWHPPMGDMGSYVETALQQLTTEGWIIPRLDGYEATPQALAEYPAFNHQDDIKDPQATQVMRAVHDPRAWHEARSPDPMILTTGQRMDMPIEHTYLVKGGITLEALGSTRRRMEIEVVLRYRELPIDDKET